MHTSDGGVDDEMEATGGFGHVWAASIATVPIAAPNLAPDLENLPIWFFR
jgi:hypothetical protein